MRESPLSADEQAMLNDVERAGVCSYFVEGAPATITRNIETADGLVNSCDAALHSLTLPDGFDFSEHMARRAVVRDGVTEVELEAPPRSINVVPSVSAALCSSALALPTSSAHGTPNLANLNSQLAPTTRGPVLRLRTRDRDRNRRNCLLGGGDLIRERDPRGGIWLERWTWTGTSPPI